ncbi:hypothetical protein BW41_02471 [Sphingomonas sp. RIT328]|nr:hypothetical protein BW41_02471 [Sphingomonas sp. RIT328]
MARRRHHLGQPSNAAAGVDVFGTRMTVAAPDLPGHLPEVAAALGLPVDCLIEGHTLLPYYLAFQSSDVRRRAIDVMRRGDATRVHHWLGLTAFRVDAPKVLRFCPACHVDEMDRLGERLWLRAHQLPGSVVCHVHGEVLRSSRVFPRQLRRNQFMRATDESCPVPPVARIRPSALPVLLDIAKRQAALCCEPRQPRSATDWMPLYRRRLAEAGLMRSRHKVDQRRLADALSDHFGASAAYLPQACRQLGAGGWQEELVRTHRRAIHPLLHVMMESFLDVAAPVTDPFGRGPWPCLNPLSEHNGDHRIREMDRYRNRDAVVGVFACDCGHSYTRGISPEGVLLPPRLRSAGPLLDKALHRLVRPGAPLRETARRVGMDPKTMIRHALSLGLAIPWTTRSSGRAIAPSIRAELPDDGHMPKPKVRSVRKARVDWQSMDIDVAAKLRGAARLIAAELPPRRVTLAELERRVASVGWIAKRRGKLPSCASTVVDVAEGLDDFQRRRARYFCRLLGDGAPAWQVMRAAGLRCRHLGMIEDELRDLRRPIRRAA